MMVLASDGQTELTLFSAQPCDTGFYTCRIENDTGVREAHCQLHVQGEVEPIKEPNGAKTGTSASSYRLYRSVLYTPTQYYSRY